MRGTRSVPLVLVLLILAALLPAGASAQSADERALSEARAKVADVERQLRQARSVVEVADEELREADRQLAELEEAVNEVAEALERQAHLVEVSRERLRLLAADVRAQEDAFALRASDLYKRGVGIPFAAVLDAGSIGDAMDRSAYVQALTSSDRAALERLIATRTMVAAERSRLDAERERLEDMKAQQEAMLAEVAELRRHRALRLADARAEAASLQRHRDDLSADARAIEKLIEERKKAAAAAQRYARNSSAASASGTVSTAGHIWPRCDRVTSEYGRRWGRMHQGIDIDGDTGDPIYASKGGRVIHAGWQGGYGRLVLVDHLDGVVTAYAHMSAFSVQGGQHVAQGQRLGSVGNTGNSTGPHLHFETRVNGSAVNPREFLPAHC